MCFRPLSHLTVYSKKYRPKKNLIHLQVPGWSGAGVRKKQRTGFSSTGFRLPGNAMGRKKPERDSRSGFVKLSQKF